MLAMRPSEPRNCLKEDLPPRIATAGSKYVPRNVPALTARSSSRTGNSILAILEATPLPSTTATLKSAAVNYLTQAPPSNFSLATLV